MLIGDLQPRDLRRRLAGEGLALDFGTLRARVRSPLRGLADVVQLLYGQLPVVELTGFFDISAALERVSGLRRWVRPQIMFVLEGKQPFEPFPANTHLPLLEWGLNWAIANRSHRYLVLHAGVVQRAGQGILLPALPGSGKSTLTAALCARGYRLLSDEFGLVRLQDGLVCPSVKPIALKNKSIEVIREFAPEAVIGPVFPKTRKGRVAHVAPTAESVMSRHETAAPRLVVFPRYIEDADPVLEPVSKSQAFIKLAANSFNYQILGPDGFEAMARLVDQCQCFRLRYSRLEDAIGLVERQVGAAAPAKVPARLTVRATREQTMDSPSAVGTKLAG